MTAAIDLALVVGHAGHLRHAVAVVSHHEGPPRSGAHAVDARIDLIAVALAVDAELVDPRAAGAVAIDVGAGGPNTVGWVAGISQWKTPW